MTPEDRAVDAVDALGGEYLRFLADLVRCPTLLGQEAECQDLIYRRLVDLGLETRKWDPDVSSMESLPDFVPVDREYADRPNVAGVLLPSGTGRAEPGPQRARGRGAGRTPALVELRSLGLRRFGTVGCTGAAPWT